MVEITPDRHAMDATPKSPQNFAASDLILGLTPKVPQGGQEQQQFLSAYHQIWNPVALSSINPDFAINYPTVPGGDHQNLLSLPADVTKPPVLKGSVAQDVLGDSTFRGSVPGINNDSIPNATHRQLNTDGSSIERNADGSSIERNGKNQIVEETDTRGRVSSISYDTAGNVAELKDSTGSWRTTDGANWTNLAGAKNEKWSGSITVNQSTGEIVRQQSTGRDQVEHLNGAAPVVNAGLVGRPGDAPQPPTPSLAPALYTGMPVPPRNELAGTVPAPGRPPSAVTFDAGQPVGAVGTRGTVPHDAPVPMPADSTRALALPAGGNFSIPNELPVALVDNLPVPNELPGARGANLPVPNELPGARGANLPVPNELPGARGANLPVPNELPETHGATLPNPNEVPVAHGAELPVPTGHELPVAHGAELPVPTGHESPVARGVELPVLTGHESPVAHGAELPVPTGHESPVAHGTELTVPTRTELPVNPGAERIPTATNGTLIAPAGSVQLDGSATHFSPTSPLVPGGAEPVITTRNGLQLPAVDGIDFVNNGPRHAPVNDTIALGGAEAPKTPIAPGMGGANNGLISSAETIGLTIKGRNGDTLPGIGTLVPSPTLSKDTIIFDGAHSGSPTHIDFPAIPGYGSHDGLPVSSTPVLDAGAALRIGGLGDAVPHPAMNISFDSSGVVPTLRRDISPASVAGLDGQLLDHVPGMAVGPVHPISVAGLDSQVLEHVPGMAAAPLHPIAVGFIDSQVLERVPGVVSGPANSLPKDSDFAILHNPAPIAPVVGDGHVGGIIQAAAHPAALHTETAPPLMLHDAALTNTIDCQPPLSPEGNRLLSKEILVPLHDSLVEANIRLAKEFTAAGKLNNSALVVPTETTVSHVETPTSANLEGFHSNLVHQVSREISLDLLQNVTPDVVTGVVQASLAHSGKPSVVPAPAALNDALPLNTGAAFSPNTFIPTSLSAGYGQSALQQSGNQGGVPSNAANTSQDSINSGRDHKGSQHEPPTQHPSYTDRPIDKVQPEKAILTYADRKETIEQLDTSMGAARMHEQPPRIVSTDYPEATRKIAQETINESEAESRRKLEDAKLRQREEDIRKLNDTMMTNLATQRQEQADKVRANQLREENDRKQEFIRQDNRQEKYIVKLGDTVEGITKKKLGSLGLVTLVYDLNKSKIQIQLENGRPNYDVKVGTILWLPSPRQVREFRQKMLLQQANQPRYGSDSTKLSPMDAARRANIEKLLGPITFV